MARRDRIGGTLTWVLGIVGCVAIIGLLAYNRRQRRRFGFPLRPMWAEVLLGVVGCLVVLGLAAFANAQLLAARASPPGTPRSTTSPSRRAA